MTAALMDNWLLQDVAELLCDGPSSKETSLIAIDRPRDAHAHQPVPLACIQAEALVNLLVDIVVRERIEVDAAFAHAWNTRPTCLDLLRERGVLAVREIDNRTPLARHARDRALRELCITSTMRTTQSANLESFRRTGESADARFAAIVWGTAGNLGRSAECGLPYSPHPSRSHLLRQTAFRTPSAADEVVSWLRHERAAVFARSVAEGEFRQATLVLPPFVVEILESCSSLDALVSVALQVRERHGDLRAWIAEFQTAIDQEDGHELLKHRRTLASVSQYLGNRTVDPRLGSTGLTLGYGWFNHTLPIPGPGDLFQRIGIRGTLNRLILTHAGGRSLDRLIGLLGETRSTLGRQVHDHLMASFSGDRPHGVVA